MTITIVDKAAMMLPRDRRGSPAPRLVLVFGRESEFFQDPPGVGILEGTDEDAMLSFHDWSTASSFSIDQPLLGDDESHDEGEGEGEGEEEAEAMPSYNTASPYMSSHPENSTRTTATPGEQFHDSTIPLQYDDGNDHYRPRRRQQRTLSSRRHRTRTRRSRASAGATFSDPFGAAAFGSNISSRGMEAEEHTMTVVSTDSSDNDIIADDDSIELARQRMMFRTRRPLVRHQIPGHGRDSAALTETLQQSQQYQQNVDPTALG